MLGCSPYAIIVLIVCVMDCPSYQCGSRESIYLVMFLFSLLGKSQTQRQQQCGGTLGKLCQISCQSLYCASKLLEQNRDASVNESQSSERGLRVMATPFLKFSCPQGNSFAFTTYYYYYLLEKAVQWIRYLKKQCICLKIVFYCWCFFHP